MKGPTTNLKQAVTIIDKKVKGVVRKLNRQNKPELKMMYYTSNNLTLAANAVNVIKPFDSIVKGDAHDERNGDEIYVEKVEFLLYFEDNRQETTAGELAKINRVLVVLDKLPPQDGSFDAQDLFIGLPSIVQMYSPANPYRFIKKRDINWITRRYADTSIPTLMAPSTNPTFNRTYSMKINKRVSYTALYNSPIKNGLVFVTILEGGSVATASLAPFRIDCVVHFTDV